MGKIRKFTAVALAAVMAAGSVCVQGAQVNEKEKEEVVYVGMDADGNVTDINVVNIFGSGVTNDYGDYTSVKILNTTDEITYSDSRVSFESDADKVYYQGTMKNDTQIPWNISIRYELDGKSLKSDEVAGKSGALKIYFDVKKNELCSLDFYDDYALQATFTLDTDKCKNIVADGATMANVGSDKQINFTILPGNGINAVISADVTDFEMDAAAINGVKLGLDIDVDNDGIKDKVQEAIDATGRLNDGAGSLYDGAEQLVDGGSSLNDGVQTIFSGVTDLDVGIENLQTGVAAMQEGLNTLNSNSYSLVSGSAQMLAALGQLQTSVDSFAGKTDSLGTLASTSTTIKNSISTMASQLSQMSGSITTSLGGSDVSTAYGSVASALSSMANSESDTTKKAALNTAATMLSSDAAIITGLLAMESGLNQLDSGYATFDGYIQQLTTLSSALPELKSGIDTLVTEYAKLDAGIDEYTGGVSTVVSGYSQLVDGVASLASGSKELLEGTGTLKDGTADLYDGIVSLCDGTQELKDGTTRFFDEADSADAEMHDKLGTIIDNINGEEKQLQSFVSSDNVNVASVQFVIKTAPVEKPEVVQADDTEAVRMTFWQKLKKLFK